MSSSSGWSRCYNLLAMYFVRVRHHQRRTSLLALFVLLWGLLFPSLAQAGIGNADTVWTEICTAQGIKKVQQSGGEMPPAAHQLSAEHCLLCYLGGGLAATESQPLWAGLLAESEPLQLPLLHVTLPQQIIPLHAPPRAPPVLSPA